jgi:hypothetical protein
MIPMKIATAGLVTAVALSLAACGETNSEKAEIVTCKKVAQLALHDPETLNFLNERLEETSEGDQVFLEVEFKNGETSGHLWDMCWFAGYGDKKRLKSFSTHDSQTAEFQEIPAEELAAIKSQIIQ